MRSTKNKTCKKLEKKKNRKRQTDIEFALSWYPVQYLALFGPSQRKGLLKICNRKQTRKYDYMLNEVACKKENKTKSKFKKRDFTCTKRKILDRQTY